MHENRRRIGLSNSNENAISPWEKARNANMLFQSLHLDKKRRMLVCEWRWEEWERSEIWRIAKERLKLHAKVNKAYYRAVRKDKRHEFSSIYDYLYNSHRRYTPAPQKSGAYSPKSRTSSLKPPTIFNRLYDEAQDFN